MSNLDALKSANAARWANAKLIRAGAFSGIAKALVGDKAKQRYITVSNQTGVPWTFIALAHERESSQNWGRSLAQGDPWNAVSVHVPAGRGPFGSWEAAAIDALTYNGAKAPANNRDWSIGGLLTELEAYNGLGYFNGPVTMRNGIVIARYPSQASPYLWSGTDQYKSGKYVRDRVFDPNAVDQQLGCAGLLMAMMAIDPTITFTGVVITPRPKPIPVPRKPVPRQPAPPPAPQPAWNWLTALLNLIFRRK